MVCSNTITQCYEEQEELIASSSALVVLDNVSGKPRQNTLSEPYQRTPAFLVEVWPETLHDYATSRWTNTRTGCACRKLGTELMARASHGDMVAPEASTHSSVCWALYYRAKTTVEAEQKTDHEGVISRIVLAELVLYIRVNPPRRGHRPVFRLGRFLQAIHYKMEELVGLLCARS
ncbi:hypothetical protein GWK47_040723 [Chionoecetes opilio]|uniref:Uncharacterized protein n=1 Tax=Chionoecetes opilio TaxID=41210 RepID=A0A8J4YJJ9_CHIOP|nr:hypothetical protein GWK47_040723 [Chionoecetes opilio]